MERILNDINAMQGVIGSFVCDEQGQLLAKALPEVYSWEMLNLAGRNAAQTTTGLWLVKQRQVGDVDLVFSGGRLIIKGLERASLCILCTPQLNLPLLNLNAAVAVKRLQKKISEAVSRPLAAPAPAKRERLKKIAEEILGDRSRKILDMLSEAKDDKPENLQAICNEAVRFTGFFMSTKKAEELSRRMRAVIDE